MITLTEEQAQQIEEALELFMDNVESPPDKNCSCHISPPCSDCFNYSGLRGALTVGPQALATIRAARAQEPETVVCESCGETVPECRIAGETESGGVACVGCVVAYFEDRATALEKRADAIATAVMTDNQYHDSLLRQRDYLLDALEDIADGPWNRIGCVEVARKAIAKITGEIK